MDRSRKGAHMDKPLLEILAWLFAKSEEDILVEAEIAAITSMYLAEDPRPEVRF
ncbi:MAG: hypothetical protein WBF42_11300 [Terracidiphilus sp.]